MSDNSEAKIATADALTLLLHNQHAICAAIEEITKWLSENGVGSVSANALGAMETLDTNAHPCNIVANRLIQLNPQDKLGIVFSVVHLVAVLVAFLAVGVLEHFCQRLRRLSQDTPSTAAFGWAAADVSHGSFSLAASPSIRAFVRLTGDRGQRAVGDQSGK